MIIKITDNMLSYAFLNEKKKNKLLISISKMSIYYFENNETSISNFLFIENF